MNHTEVDGGLDTGGQERQRHLRSSRAVRRWAQHGGPLGDRPSSGWAHTERAATVSRWRWPGASRSRTGTRTPGRTVALQSSSRVGSRCSGLVCGRGLRRSLTSHDVELRSSRPRRPQTAVLAGVGRRASPSPRLERVVLQVVTEVARLAGRGAQGWNPRNGCVLDGVRAQKRRSVRRRPAAGHPGH